MSEIPFTPGNQLLSAPEHIPTSVLGNIPAAARQFGHPDISDGINNIGDIEIITPEESAVCARSYTTPLMRLAKKGAPIPPELEAQLHTKVSLGALSAREFAAVGFNFPTSQELRLAMLPGMKKNISFLVFSAGLAKQHQFVQAIRTKAKPMGKDVHSATVDIQWQDKTYTHTATGTSRRSTFHAAFFNTYLSMIDVDPDSIPEPTERPLAPVKALESYIRQYGGQYGFDKSDDTQVRAMILEHYQSNLRGKIFYPDPLKALASIYSGYRQEWSDRHRKNYFHVSGVRFLLNNTTDEYTVRTHGPNRDGARQAAARLILEHLEATDLSLLQ